jgi:hypothetical protein
MKALATLMLLRHLATTPGKRHKPYGRYEANTA